MEKEKYKFISTKRLHEIYMVLKQNKKSSPQDIAMLDHLLLFLAEYNSPRSFFQKTRRVKFGTEYKEIPLKRWIPFWPRKDGAVHRLPWKRKLKGLKFREGYWLVNEKLLQKRLGISK